MIYLIQNDREYDYDVRAIALAFYERTKIVEVTKEELTEKERKKIAEAGLKRCQTSDYSNEGMIKNVLNSIFQTIK